MQFFKSFYKNFKSISLAIIIAIIIRSFLFEPFNIPSGSMKPNLLVGDFIFVTKWNYGYSKHSLPFSLPLIPKKIFTNYPDKGEIVIFKTPSDNRTDYIKRVIGLPGDKIQIIEGTIYLNNEPILRTKINDFIDIDNLGIKKRIRQYEEKIDNHIFKSIDLTDSGLVDNTSIFTVPDKHIFVMGDNRDNSQDSRFIRNVGYIPIENLTGKAQIIFFSLENSRFFQFWKWPSSIRFNRIFKKIK
ncbi:MAG: Signal peptidase I [Alphaproteobacteria bacterium MarineAlpha5_Bin9]|nr:MAG: Signal peptidase I [Alphaproteobacteria bacterium MarineAlpha5_Bin9]|tara:strand:+ start:7319 stop:8047 length:729 start_codon:yes stop_codon:yes gene_type:complete